MGLFENIRRSKNLEAFVQAADQMEKKVTQHVKTIAKVAKARGLSPPSEKEMEQLAQDELSEIMGASYQDGVRAGYYPKPSKA